MGFSWLFMKFPKFDQTWFFEMLNKISKKIFEIYKKKPIIPSRREIEMNPASRSAKLRFASKIRDIDEYEKKIRAVVGKNFNETDFKKLIFLGEKEIKNKI